MDGLETSAKTVEEAVAKALKQLGLDTSQVDVEVVSQGRPGILGFGGEPARVIVRPRGAAGATGAPTETAARPARGGRRRAAPSTATAEPEDEARSPAADRPAGEDVVPAAVEIVENLLDLMHIEANVTSRPPTTPGDGVGMVTAVIDVHGDDLGLLIGRRGETLASFQYVVNLMLARRTHARVMVGIDVGGYRRRREESLRTMALRVAERVRATGVSQTLEPMPPAERRIVHITLSDSPHVVTVSIGEGDNRKVAITPRR